jgi:uncharacterized protein (DUF1501 family)
MKNRFSFPKSSRRDLLRAGMYGIGVSAAGIPIPLFAQAAAQLTSQGKADGKILVVLELSGGNDGLNTFIPYGDDAYYRHRPHLGIPKKDVRVIDSHFGFSKGMAGFERYIRTGSWRWCTAAATRIHRFRISPQWRTGTRLRRTAAKNTDGWGGWRMRWHRRLRRITW